MGNNTAAMGWLRQSNFRDNEEGDIEWLAKQKVAWKLASIISEADDVLYRQLFKGSDNIIADSLSWDEYFLCHNTHKCFLLMTVPSLLPQNFNI